MVMALAGLASMAGSLAARDRLDLGTGGGGSDVGRSTAMWM
jgi:hypothetical protein